jgi:hypothetical protein
MKEAVEYSDFRSQLYAPIDQDEIPHIPGYGKDSYFPLVEGFVWQYAGGAPWVDDIHANAEVKTTEIDLDNDENHYNKILIENIDGSNGQIEFTNGGNSSASSDTHFLGAHLDRNIRFFQDSSDNYDSLLDTIRTMQQDPMMGIHVKQPSPTAVN